MVANDNIISFGDSHQEQTPTHINTHQTIIKECRLLIVDSLPKCFGFFDSLDDTLFKQAEKAESADKQEELFSAMRQLRVVQGDIKKQFTQLILDDFDALWSSNHTQKSSPKLESSSELALLGNDDLEEDIAIERIASKGEEKFGLDISQLNDRFAHMLKIDNEIETHNPFSPDNMGKYLKRVISPLSVDISIKLAIYKQFELQAVTELGNLYQHLNELLFKKNILPNLGYKARKNPHSSINDDVSDENNDEQNELNEEIFNELRRLLNKAGSNKNFTPDPNAKTADLTSVLAALSNLQQATSQVSYTGDGPAQLPEVQTSLIQTLNPSQADGSIPNNTISHLDNDTMDVIALLFEFILEDNAIPAEMRALLAMLQIPMIKVAIADKAFFSKKQHPARRLLNNLAKAATGWSKSNSQNMLQKQIEDTVNRVLTEFETNIEVFDELNLQFEEFVTNQEQTSQVLEQRTTQAKQGQESLEMAQQEVDGIINQLLIQHSPVPMVAVILIEDGWKHVLKLRLLQKGKDSDEWNESVTLMQTLLSSVTPISEPGDRKKLLESIPNLLKSLRLGLSGASFNQYKMTELFKSLQACHIKCLSGNELPDNEVQIFEEAAEILTTIEQESIEPIPDDQIVLPEEAAMERAKNLKIGTWIEVTEETSSRRIKFSWRSNLTGHCLFVTYQGLKAAELSLTELARWFQKGQAIVLDKSSPLMDRALKSMMNTVNKTK